jgi:hypothetical protein
MCVRDKQPAGPWRGEQGTRRARGRCNEEESMAWRVRRTDAGGLGPCAHATTVGYEGQNVWVANAVTPDATTRSMQRACPLWDPERMHAVQSCPMLTMRQSRGGKEGKEEKGIWGRDGKRATAPMCCVGSDRRGALEGGGNRGKASRVWNAGLNGIGT